MALLNVDKTCYIKTNNEKVDGKRIEIAGKVVTKADKVKLLGVLIDYR